MNDHSPRRAARLRPIAAAALGLAAAGSLLAAALPLASASGVPNASLRSSSTLGGGVPEPATSDPDEEGRRALPLPVRGVDVPRLEVVATPIPAPRGPGVGTTPPPGEGSHGGTTDATEGGCPPVVLTHSGADFSGGSFVAQAGFVENEIAAASYTIDASEFPIRLDLAEMIFVTANATVPTTTQWSLLVWEGTPATGAVIAEFSSDGIILPPIELPPGTGGVNVQVLVDPSDPEQIIITNDGSATFSIGYRIDEHNQPSSLPCLIGPAPCCNAFPATDTDGLAEPSRNWLRGINCGAFGCPPGGGWASFAQLDPLCRPSGDWVIRATWTSLGCGGGDAGACCLPDGSCAILLPADCEAEGGIYQGDGVLCGQVSCPEPEGACCFGTFCAVETQFDCEFAGGTFLGVGTDCSDDPCNPDGACCIPATGGCLTLSAEDCELVGGVFQGPFTACGDVICFPEGACCLPDGGCVDGLSPAECADLEGVFQGDGSTCGTVDCPEPTGACCLQDGAVCLALTEADCATVAGTWAGPGTDCEDGDGDGRADDCGACAEDLDGSGSIDFQDLLQVLGTWGDCDGPCPTDLDQSGTVDFGDVLAVLSAFGPC